MDVTLVPPKTMNRRIASLPGVRAVVSAQAEKMAPVASAFLAMHRKSGQFHIEVNHRMRGMRYKKYDSFVTLVAGPGENALAAETGHINSGRFAHLAPRRVGGIHVLRDTMAAFGAASGYHGDRGA